MSNYDNTYGELQGIINNLNVLFDDLELPRIECNFTIPGTLLLFIENIASSGTIEKNIREINKQLEGIVSEYETRISTDIYEENLSEEREEEAEKLPEKLFDEKDGISCVKVKSVFEDVEYEKAEKPIKTEKTENSADEAIMNLIGSVIAMRDNLILRQGMIEMQNPEMAQQSEKVLNTVMLETTHMLEQNNVTVLNDEGVFDSETQTIIGAEKTDNEALKDTIVKTVRMGYKYKEKLIRPQEVIVYSLAE